MGVTLTDPIVAPSRASLKQLRAWYTANWGAVPADVDDYLFELDRLCTLVGFDLLLLAFQSAHETWNVVSNMPWDSFWFKTRLNPAGLGITGDPTENAASPTFKSGTDAARAHVVHMHAYAKGPIFPGVGSVLAPYIDLDPRYFAVFDAFGRAPSVQKLGDLGNGKWATDSRYSQQIADRANKAFGVSMGTASTTKVPVSKTIIPAGRSNRPGTKLPSTGQLFIVIHETGNESPGARAQSQIDYIASNGETLCGGGGRCVSYHFSVDDRGIVQGLPLDEIGYHAGDGCDDPVNDIGCFRSVAIEGCVNRDGDEAQMRRNYAQLIARICAGDPAFDWGGGSTKGRFDIDHLKLHIEVSTPGPDQHHCPDHMLSEGFIPTFYEWVDEAWAIFGTTPAKPKYPLWDKPDWWEKATAQDFPSSAEWKGVQWDPARIRVELRGNCYPYTTPKVDSTGHAGPILKKGQVIRVERVGVVGTRRWYMAREGFYIPAQKTSRIVVVKPNPTKESHHE